MLRYTEVSDNSGHHYIIPVRYAKDWSIFLGLDEEDEESWDVPVYAKRIEGMLTFSNPRVE